MTFKPGYKPGYSTTIILRIIIEAGQKGITIKNLQAKAREAYEAGNFGRSKLPEKRVKHMKHEYIKHGLIEKDGDFYKATPALFLFMENLDN